MDFSGKLAVFPTQYYDLNIVRGTYQRGQIMKWLNTQVRASDKLYLNPRTQYSIIHLVGTQEVLDKVIIYHSMDIQSKH